VSELSFHHMTHTDNVNAVVKQKGAKRVGRIWMKKKKKAVYASVIPWCYRVYTSYYTTWLRESLNTVVLQPPEKIHTAMRSLNNSQK
jgi:hypothetical protein